MAYSLLAKFSFVVVGVVAVEKARRSQLVSKWAAGVEGSTGTWGTYGHGPNQNPLSLLLVQVCAFI